MIGEAFAKAEKLAAHVKEYANTRLTIAKLEVAEKTSAVVSNLVAGAIVALVFFLSLIFAGIAAAYVFAGLLGKLYAGFLVVAGIYLLLGIVLWKGRERMLRIPIMNAVIRQLFKPGNHEKD